MHRPSLPILLLTAVGAIALGSGWVAFAANGKPTKPAAPAAVAAPAPANGDGPIRAAIVKLVPGTKVESVRATPVAGVMEVTTSDDLIYMTADGKYLLTGNLIDVASKRDLTEASRAVARRTLLRDVRADQMVVFAAARPKYTVTVFTDVDCGYCRKLHSQIADYNRLGITVDYLFYPRDGLGSEAYDKAVAVWCASNRQQALTDAKKGLPMKKVNCNNPVTMDYKLGQKFGVQGTPAIYAADGTQIGGYLSPADMKAKLDQLAAKPAS